MRKEAEAHTKRTGKRANLAEARNNADNLAYQSEKQLRDLEDKLSADQKQAVKDAIKNVRKELNGNDVEAIKQATEELQNRFQSISAELYKQAAFCKPVRDPVEALRILLRRRDFRQVG